MTSKVETNAFEKQRELLIKRNRERLLALGFDHGFDLHSTVTGVAASKKKKRQQKPKEEKTSEVVSHEVRRSKRKRKPDSQKTDDDGELPSNTIDNDEQLVSLEDKPRPVYRKSGSSVGARSWEERIAELELSGLVNFSKEEGAKFIVIGSTGNKYEVLLSDEKRKCQCLDHRLRKRDCKHIKLVLKQLETSDDPDNWFDAVNKMVAKQLV